jgi:hypothetical protein
VSFIFQRTDIMHDGHLAFIGLDWVGCLIYVYTFMVNAPRRDELETRWGDRAGNDVSVYSMIDWTERMTKLGIDESSISLIVITCNAVLSTPPSRICRACYPLPPTISAPVIKANTALPLAIYP